MADDNRHEKLYGPITPSKETLAGLMRRYELLIQNHQKDPNPFVTRNRRCENDAVKSSGAALTDPAFFTRMFIDGVLSSLEKKETHSGIPKWMTNVDRILVALSEEISELRNWLPWKHWRTYEGYKLPHRRELQMEVVDMLHFVFNLALLTGLTGEELAGLFEEKMKINEARWKGNY